MKIHAVYSIIVYNCTIAEKGGGMGRMVIKKSFTNPKSIYAILLLSVFTFLFLGAEYLYVNMISLTAGEEKTVITQNYALGISAVGFLLYPLFHRETATAWWTAQLDDYDPISATGLNFLGTTPMRDADPI